LPFPQREKGSGFIWREFHMTCQYHTERGIANPAAAGASLSNIILTSLTAASRSTNNNFENYLKTQKKRNVRQIICYAQRYAAVLETGDATALVNLSSGAVRRHAMEALTALSKYAGCYDRWQQIYKRYSLKWTDGNESLQAMQRFFNDELNFDSMLRKVKEMIAKTPVQIGQIIKFACLTGLRPTEAIESVRLLNRHPVANYYNPQRQALEHFRFPEIFLRQTKKAYISFVSPEILQTASTIGDAIPSYNAIRRACYNNGRGKCDMRFCRKIFASWLHSCGIQSEIIDFLQGRVSKSVFTRHYLTPNADYRDKVLQALHKLRLELE
jgi:Archaeal phage integrase